MKPLSFRVVKGGDAYEFLKLSYKMLEVVGLVDSLGVRFVALKLQGVSREWW